MATGAPSLDKPEGMTGFLGWIERSGNKLPDPVFLFFYLIIALVIISVIASLTGVSALHPTSIDETTGGPLRIDAVSLLAAENIQKLWVEMPKTFICPCTAAITSRTVEKPTASAPMVFR